MNVPRRDTDTEAVRQGFSNMASVYDALDETHPVIIWMRARIRSLVELYLPVDGSMLEINAGSGLDALYFASKGYRVHATDFAPGMLEALAEKARRPEADSRLTYEALSNTDLSGVSGGPYDLLLSNLGGLNCTEDLTSVTRHFPAILKPGARSVLVVMPPLCPWELLQALRGHFGTAKRRISKQGTLANVGGAQVPTWYHAAGKLERALGPGFRTLTLRSYCLFSPPSYFEGFARRHPTAIRRLEALDDRLGALPPFNRLGDFYALVSQRQEQV